MFWTVFFAIMMFISMFGWLVCYVSTKSLLLYMKKKGYELPRKKEIKKYCKYVARDEFGLEFKDID